MKSSTHVAKMCSAKFSPFKVKASPKTASHKIHWLQFVNNSLIGLRYWHSSIHFQIPMTSALSTTQLRLGTDCNFGFASTTICERGFFKHNWVKSDRRSRLKLGTLDHASMRVSLCYLLMENMDWARKLGTWKSIENQRALPMELDDD